MSWDFKPLLIFWKKVYNLNVKKFFLNFILLCNFIFIFAQPLPQNDKGEVEEVENPIPAFTTLKEKLKYKFDNIYWIKDDSLKTTELAMPYNLGDTKTDASYLYAQANTSDAIVAELEGLGELNYFGVEYDVLQYCEKLSKDIIAKSLPDTDVFSKRQFLKYFFNIALSELPNVTSIFYARPEIYEDKISTSFRLNFSQTEEGISYALAKAVAISENDRWVLYEFQIGNVEYEKIEQN